MGQQVSTPPSAPKQEENPAFHKSLTKNSNVITPQNVQYQNINEIPNARGAQQNPYQQQNPNYNQYNQMIQNQQIQRPNVPKRNYKGTITTADLKANFLKHSIDGKYLNKDRFNDTIESIFLKFNIPRLHYTYLSSKLYEFLDESKDSKISEEEFISGMTGVLSNRDLRIKLSMSAMMTKNENRNYLEFNEIVDFFYKSWIQAYRHLGWNVKKDKVNFISKNIPVPTITQFELFATKQESNIRIYLQNDFRQCGIDINQPIQYETFVKWIYQDHVIYLNFSFKQVAIATSLIYLDEIEFIDNLGSNQAMAQGNMSAPGMYLK